MSEAGLASNLRRLLDRHPSAKAGVKAVLAPFRQLASDKYRVLPEGLRAPALENLKAGWQDSSIPAKQRVAVERSLSEYRQGLPVREFDVLVDLLRPHANVAPGCSLLEIGCSSGYYSEVFATKGLGVHYAGCDYSPTFIDLARALYPQLRFDVEDATALRYANDAFDVVVSGGCLLHVPDYPRGVAETARVARRLAAFHRTPVLHTGATRYFSKRAYGVQTLEIHFSEREFVDLLYANGLQVIAIASLGVDWRGGDALATKTYLCEKKTAHA